DRLTQEALKLGEAGKLAEAVAAAEKGLTIERSVFGNFHAELTSTLDFIAQIHELREDFAAARKSREEVLEIQTKLHGKENCKVTIARLALEDLELLSRLKPEDRVQLKRANHLNLQVFNLYKEGKFKEALAQAQEAIELRRKVLGENHPQF